MKETSLYRRIGSRTAKFKRPIGSIRIAIEANLQFLLGVKGMDYAKCFFS